MYNGNNHQHQSSCQQYQSHQLQWNQSTSLSPFQNHHIQQMNMNHYFQESLKLAQQDPTNYEDVCYERLNTPILPKYCIYNQPNLLSPLNLQRPRPIKHPCYQQPFLLSSAPPSHPIYSPFSPINQHQVIIYRISIMLKFHESIKRFKQKCANQKSLTTLSSKSPK